MDRPEIHGNPAGSRIVSKPTKLPTASPVAAKATATMIDGATIKALPNMPVLASSTDENQSYFMCLLFSPELLITVYDYAATRALAPN